MKKTYPMELKARSIRLIYKVLKDYYKTHEMGMEDESLMYFLETYIDRIDSEERCNEVE